MRIYTDNPKDSDKKETEFVFPKPGPKMFTLTCVKHPEGRWLTKNPFERSIHFAGWDRLDENIVMHPEFGMSECTCPYTDLRVIVDEKESAKNG